MEYQIQANTRRCVVTGRELRPGETVFSVLLDEQGRFVRKDYARDAWQGPPDGAFSFWSARVPAEQNRRPRIDDDLLMECLTRLAGDEEPGRRSFRFVVALLLMRRKRLRFEEARRLGESETLLLRCARTGMIHEVVNPLLADEEMVAAQDEVFRVLGWE